MKGKGNWETVGVLLLAVTPIGPICALYADYQAGLRSLASYGATAEPAITIAGALAWAWWTGLAGCGFLLGARIVRELVSLQDLFD